MSGLLVMAKRGPKPHDPSPVQRELVSLHTTVGTDQETIAKILGIDPKTLRRYYREELDLSKAKANAKVGGSLFNKAIGGDTAAMIFWMKTQAGWKETTVNEHDLSNPLRLFFEEIRNSGKRIGAQEGN